MSEFVRIFRKMGGMALLRQYARAGVLLPALLTAPALGFSRKSLELLRLSLAQRVQARLRKRYAAEVAQFVQRHSGRAALAADQPRRVWICWLQGEEQAPPLVRKCIASVRRHLRDRELVLVTKANLMDHVSLPPHVQAKVDSGAITRTHLSDILRLELLSRFGGTWIDATVYCSGGDIPSYMLDDALFVFQNLKPGRDGHSINLSSWFITAQAGHPIIELAKELLYAYWREHDELVDYFLVHHFIQIAAETFPDDWRQIVPFSNATPHILLLMMFERFDAQRWRHIRQMVPFHKLTYKADAELAARPGTYHEVLLRDGLP